MFAGFVTALRNEGVPVSLTEYLTLVGAMKAGVARATIGARRFIDRPIARTSSRSSTRQPYGRNRNLCSG